MHRESNILINSKCNFARGFFFETLPLVEKKTVWAEKISQKFEPNFSLLFQTKQCKFVLRFWPYKFHCGDFCAARRKAENSGDVRPSEAPRPVPVSPATFHVDIFSSVVCLQTLTKPKTSNSSCLLLYNDRYSIIKAPLLVWLLLETACRETCWWSVGKRNKAVWLKWLRMGAGR